MNWKEVCADPNLSDLPYKIELNERGQILMSPARLLHSLYQAKIIKLLIKLIDHGEVIPEFAIATEKGTKVPDVVWCSEELLNQVKYDPESSIAPELCIEVLSPTNTDNEIDEKRNLYFSLGAKEVWICDEKGEVQFYNKAGKIKNSNMCPPFPDLVKV